MFGKFSFIITGYHLSKLSMMTTLTSVSATGSLCSGLGFEVQLICLLNLKRNKSQLGPQYRPFWRTCLISNCYHSVIFYCSGLVGLKLDSALISLASYLLLFYHVFAFSFSFYDIISITMWCRLDKFVCAQYTHFLYYLPCFHILNHNTQTYILVGITIKQTYILVG